MSPTRFLPAFAAGYDRPHINGGGRREEQSVVPDRNRGLRWSQDGTKILTQIGHFNKEEATSVASLR